MKSEILFRTIGQISDETIMEADVETDAEAAEHNPVKPILRGADIFKQKPARPALLRWGAVAACLVVAIVITIPMMQRDTGADPGNETAPEITLGTTRGELAELYDNLNIYYVTDDNELAFESVYTRYAPEDIFQKWAELNNVEGVTLIKAFLDSNGFETIHGDPEDPETMVSYTVGDRFTLEITLSSEYKTYADGENGGLLAESLERTFREYNESIELAEFNLIISEP